MTIKNRQPGDLTKDSMIDEFIRVNQAGELGAKRIYAGQLAVLRKKSSKKIIDTIEHMAAQEEEHLAYFSEQISERKVRPTIMSPIWEVGAFALGAATALMGEKAAMACTVAVEEEIDRHYSAQLEQLEDNEDESDLKEKIEKFRAQELEHRDIGLENDAEKAAAYPLLYSAVSGMTKLAIAISKKV